MISKKELLSKAMSDDEKILFSKIYDKYMKTYKYFETTNTDFLNPIVVSKMHSMFKFDSEIEIRLDGGLETAERKIVTFVNKNAYEPDINTPLCACKITYNSKFSKELKHKDFLGALIGLGIKREKIGDINLLENYAVVIIYSDIASFVLNNLQQIGRTKVKIEEVTLENVENLFESNPKKEKIVTVSSLRIDAIIAVAFNLSRSNAQKYIRNEKVFVNWSVANNASKEVKIDDIITVRGAGRIKIEQLKGISKKGKNILSIKIF